MASERQADSGKPSPATTLKAVAVTSADLPFAESDSDAEQVLLELANQARSQARLAPLKLDEGLSRAAYAHAQAMVFARQLSHQCEGEPTLAQRLAVATRTQFDQEGENVALDGDAESAHRHLMLSAPHRANLLNASYNEIGLAVVRAGDELYIVQDFARALPSYSTSELKDQIAAAVTQAQSRAKRHNLSRVDLPVADDAACSMARADRLETSSIQQLAARYTVLTYTTLHPEILPANAGGALAARSLRSFSVGVCYAKTGSYPMGVYWVALALAP